MERLNTDIGPAKSSLQKALEVFESVGVNCSVYVGFRVIDDFVSVLGLKPVVGLQSIGIQSRSRSHIAADLSLKVMLAPKVYTLRAHLASLSLQKAEHNGLAFPTATVDLLSTLGSVHVSGLAADESLISIDRARHLVDASLVLRKPDTVEHEPRGSLSSR